MSVHKDFFHTTKPATKTVETRVKTTERKSTESLHFNGGVWGVVLACHVTRDNNAFVNAYDYISMREREEEVPHLWVRSCPNF
jgi:hypothetical protein